MLTAGEFEQDRVVGCEQEIARWGISGGEDLHVPAPRGIANIHRIAEDQGGDLSSFHLLANSITSVAPDCDEVDAGALRSGVEQLKPRGFAVALISMPIEIRHRVIVTSPSHRDSTAPQVHAEALPNG